MRKEIVKMENISKTFGNIKALKDVNLTVYDREIVGLVGDNGAGKSTLIKILVGALQADSGAKIIFRGQEVQIKNPIDAIKIGIESIYQDSSLVDQLNVPRNLFLGREPTKKIGPFEYLDFKKMQKEAAKLLKEIGIKKIDLKLPISTMSGGERQSVAIARAMYFETNLIILDEPTNHLGIKESQSVLDFLVRAKENGHSSIFITHNIHHIYQVADRIIIIRHGEKIGDFIKNETSPEEVEALIIGKELGIK